MNGWWRSTRTMNVHTMSTVYETLFYGCFFSCMAISEQRGPLRTPRHAYLTSMHRLICGSPLGLLLVRYEHPYSS